MDSEQITLEIDDKPAVAAVKRANASLENYNETVLRVSDRSKNSLDRLTSSMMKQADIYGKTGVEKLIAQRDQLIQRYGGEQRAVDSITKSYEKMIAVERQNIAAQEQAKAASAAVAAARKAEAEATRQLAEANEKGGASWQKLALGAKDLFEGRSTFAAVEAGKFAASLGTVGIAAGVAAGAVFGIGVAAFESAKHLGDFGQEIENIHLRTGLAVGEVEKFSFAAKIAGTDVSVFQRLMRGLSEAADENSKQGEKVRGTLQRMGVDLRNTAGELRPTGEVLTQLATTLNKIPAGFERDAVAMDLFKRAGIESVPVMNQLLASINTFDEHHLGASDESIANWKKLHDQMVLAEETTAKLKRTIEAPLATTWTVFVKYLPLDNPFTVKGLVNDVMPFAEGIAGFVTHNFAPGAQQSLSAGDVAGAANRQMRESGLAGDRATADDMIRARSRNRSGDPQEALKDAEAALGKMTNPSIGTTSPSDTKAYYEQEGVVKQWKERIKAIQQAKEEENKLKSFENEMNQKDLGPVARIYAQRDALIKGGANEARASAAAIIGSSQALAKEGPDSDRRLSESLVRGAGEQSKRFEKEWDEVYKSVDKRAKDIVKEFQQNVDAIQDAVRSRDKNQIEGIHENIRHQGRMADISSNKEGFGGELDAYKQELGFRQQERNEEFKIKDAHKTLYDMDVERGKYNLENLKDQNQLSEKILETKKKEFDTVQASTEKLVNTLLTKPGSFGKELGSTLHAAILKPMVEGISSTVARVVTPVVYGNDGQGGIHGLLSGAFGGQRRDPVSMSTDSNTMATIQNTNALVALRDTAVSASGGGGSAGPMSGPAGYAGPSGGGLMSLLAAGAGAAVLGMPGSNRQRFAMASTGDGQFSPSYQTAHGMAGADIARSTVGYGALAASVFMGGSTTAPAAPGSGFVPGMLGLTYGDVAGYTGTGAGSNGGWFGGRTGSGGGSGFGGVLPGLEAQASKTIASGSGGAGFMKNLSGLKGTVFNQKAWDSVDSTAGGAALGIATSPLAQQAGFMLGNAGILGNRRGTWGGIGEATGGLALAGAGIGFTIGGPIGAGIGAAAGAVAGFGIGIGEKLAGVESPQNEAKRLIKTLYSISIDNQMANQIVQLAQQKYAGKVSIAVRDPDIRKMLQLYAEGTGQKFPMSQTTPVAGSLQMQNGQLQQVASFQNNSTYSYQSNLPVAGGFTNGGYGGPTSLSLNLNGQSAADLLDGRVASTVSPAFVQTQYSSALSSSNGRTSNSASIQSPGLITA